MHYEATLDFYGCDLGLRVARKHLGWYLDGIQVSVITRRRVMTSDDPAAVLRMLRTELDATSGNAGGLAAA